MRCSRTTRAEAFPIRKPLLFVLLAGWVVPVFSQIDILRLVEPQGTRVQEIAASSDGGVWLVLSRYISGRRGARSLVKVSTDLGVEWRRDLRADEVLGIVGFGSGFLIHQATQSRENAYQRNYELLFGENATEELLLVYSRANDDYPGFHFAAAPNADGIYIVENATNYEYAIRRLDETGRVVWSRSIPETQFRGLVATEEGPVLAHAPVGIDLENDGRILRFTAYTTGGKLRWESETRVRYGVLQFTELSPDKLVVMPQPGRDEVGSLMVIDANSGEIVRQLPLPRVPYRGRVPALHRTANGMLMVTELVGHPYLANVGSDGEIEWWTRFRIDNSPRATLEVRPLVDGRFAVLSSADEEAESRITLVFVDAESQELSTSYGSCLQMNPLPILALEQDMFEDYGIRVEFPYWRADPTLRPTRVEACALPSEERYYDFLMSFSDELDRQNAPRWNYWDEAVTVHVVSVEQPYQLIDYQLGALVADGPSSSFSYYADPGAGRAMARHLVNELHPHFQMAKDTVKTDFSQLTSHVLTTYDLRTMDEPPAVFMSRIEVALQEIMRQVNMLSDNELETLRSQFGYFFFNPYAFGRDYENLRPLGEVRDELRAAIRSILPQEQEADDRREPAVFGVGDPDGQ